MVDLGLDETELYEIDDIVYFFSRVDSVAVFASLIDRGANVGLQIMI